MIRARVGLSFLRVYGVYSRRRVDRRNEGFMLVLKKSCDLRLDMPRDDTQGLRRAPNYNICLPLNIQRRKSGVLVYRYGYISLGKMIKLTFKYSPTVFFR